MNFNDKIDVEIRRFPIVCILTGLRVILVSLFCLVQSHPALAYGPVHGARYLSAQAAAMGNGNAFLGAGNDLGYSLFYDPSSLALSKSVGYEPISVSLSGDMNFFPMFTGNFFLSPNLQGQRAALAESPGAYAASAGSLLTGLVLKHFAFGILLQGDWGAQDYGEGLLLYQAKYQVIPTAAFGFSLFKRHLQIGYSVQWVNQTSGLNEVSSASETLSFNEALFEGSGLSHNLGLTYKGKSSTLFHLMIRNLFGLTYTPTSSFPIATHKRGAPPNESMTLDFSMSRGFQFSRGVSLNTVVQMNDLSGQTGVPPVGRIGVALDLAFKSGSPGSKKAFAFYLRGGWGAGVPSAGVGYTRGLSAYSLTWYSEDIGAFYQELVDQRILFQYQLRFGNAASGGGSK